MNNFAETGICTLYILYALLIVAIVDGWQPGPVALSIAAWSPPCLIMLGYRWWLNDGAVCAGRE